MSWFFSQNDLPDHLLFSYSNEANEQVRSDKFILVYLLLNIQLSWFHSKWFYKEDDRADFDNVRLRYGLSLKRRSLYLQLALKNIQISRVFINSRAPDWQRSSLRPSLKRGKPEPGLGSNPSLICVLHLNFHLSYMGLGLKKMM